MAPELLHRCRSCFRLFRRSRSRRAGQLEWFWPRAGRAPPFVSWKVSRAKGSHSSYRAGSVGCFWRSKGTLCGPPRGGLLAPRQPQRRRCRPSEHSRSEARMPRQLAAAPMQQAFSPGAHKKFERRRLRDAARYAPDRRVVADRGVSLALGQLLSCRSLQKSPELPLLGAPRCRAASRVSPDCRTTRRSLNISSVLGREVQAPRPQSAVTSAARNRSSPDSNWRTSSARNLTNSLRLRGTWAPHAVAHLRGHATLVRGRSRRRAAGEGGT